MYLDGKKKFRKLPTKLRHHRSGLARSNGSSSGASGLDMRQKAQGNAADIDTGCDSSTYVVGLSATLTTIAATRNIVRTATSDFRALNAEIHRADSPLWWTTKIHRRFDLFCQHDNVYLSREGKPIIWAKHTGGVTQIQIDALSTGNSAQYHENGIPTEYWALSKFAPPAGTMATAIFSLYREFHEAIRHLHIKMNMTKGLYADPGEIPARPIDFHCETCELSKSVHHRPTPKVSPTTHKAMPDTNECGFPSENLKFPKPSWTSSPTPIWWGDPNCCDVLSVNKRFKTGNSGEYVNHTPQKFFSSRGIVHDLVPPYHHEVNGATERWNRAVMQLARAMTHSDGLLRLWAEAKTSPTLFPLGDNISRSRMTPATPRRARLHSGIPLHPSSSLTPFRLSVMTSPTPDSALTRSPVRAAPRPSNRSRTTSSQPSDFGSNASTS
ncbi:hypothetical protein J1614_012246 [Plenodomus biglobosus]|nr:hypothetical protein J1614_012246 [Plenodomus biglobosus]